ncbi:hypothetical protein DCAR_0310014 [Daucus carota subsp. sativus]|uniref:Uncharacterized protein n=1 Tax=Daucus carota subsp. sativus TaxID=79200 RepID=A0AAF0WJE1_DAUCS|nr:hypothetical protein DCAR_0310014 [Daucus carota subsp. sativus]
MTACASFFNHRAHADPLEPRVRSSGTRKLEGVAMWLVDGVAALFFASLDRCSCVRIGTCEDEDGEDDKPLISEKFYGGARSCGGRRRTGKGRK